MQDPIHIATKIRNRLLSKLANLKMGDFSIDTKYLVELIKTKSKIEHNLMKSDLNPKDRQNFASCLRISSELVLDLINRNENAKADYTEADDSNCDSDDDEFEDDDDGLAAFDDEDQMLSSTFDEDEEREGNITANDLSNVSQQNFKGCRILKKINQQQINKYFRISVDSSVKYIHKQSACWLLSTSKNRLSSDRLERVKE
ncbi:unnamed protein product [Rotaria socialis]